MKNTLAQFWLSIISLAYILIIWLNNLDSIKFKTGIALGIIVTFVISIFIEILENANILSIFILSKTIYRKYKVRFSVAYLFLIKVDDKYLLVFNNDRQHYQLVGGVYKKFTESEAIFKELNISEDIVLKTSDEKINDLRVFLPITNASKFIKWFKKETEREISPCREFYEELILTNILPRSPFIYLNYRKKGTLITPIQNKKINDFRYKQIQIFDILEFIPNDEQKKELYNLLANGDQSIRFVTENLIINSGFDPRLNRKILHIAETVKWALKMKCTD